MANCDQLAALRYYKIEAERLASLATNPVIRDRWLAEAVDFAKQAIEMERDLPSCRGDEVVG